MKRVTGVGGIFFKSDDPEKMYQWYEKHLGIKRDAGTPGCAGGVTRAPRSRG